MKIRSIKVWVSTCAALALFLWLQPDVAYANGGTPLMWAPVYHLLIGNLVIGLGEGLLLGLLYNVRKSRAILFMMGANYVSFILGAISLGTLSELVKGCFRQETFLYHVPSFLWILCGLTFLMTVVFEWPLCWALLRNRPRKWRDSILASFAAQSASYGVLVYFYLGASAISLYTEVDVTPDLVPSLPPHSLVHFTSLDDGRLYRIALNGSAREKVEELTSREEYSKHLEEQNDFGVLDLRPDQHQDWKVSKLNWAYDGISAQNKTTGSLLRVALDTPYLRWPPRFATVLPGDLVVYQLGDQIVVLDLNARKLGLLALGRGPVAISNRD